MKIIKRINTNAALALDSRGNEIVVLGKGVGFPQAPYELKDLSKIQRTFYDVKPQYLEMIAAVPHEILRASAEIAESAEMELDSDLNASLPFTLADHLNFASERLTKGMQFSIPLAYDVKHLYPKEYKLGREGLDVFARYTGKRLPDGEAVNIAMHLINAESEVGDMHTTTVTMRVTTEVAQIIERELNVTIDKESFHYSRFAMHMQYLVQRMMNNAQNRDDNGDAFREMRRKHAQVYRCAVVVAQYFKQEWQWACNDDELLYLMIHINRVSEKSKETE